MESYEKNIEMKKTASCHFTPLLVCTQIVYSDRSLTNLWAEPGKYFAGQKPEVLAVAKSDSTSNKLDLAMFFSVGCFLMKLIPVSLRGITRQCKTIIL